MTGYLIALGEHLKGVVDKLDPDLKAQIAEVVKATTFLWLWFAKGAQVVEMTAQAVETTRLLC